jgi:hypothetical protein
MLQEVPEGQLPEILDFLQYLREKSRATRSSDVEKILPACDTFVDTIHSAEGELDFFSLKGCLGKVKIPENEEQLFIAKLAEHVSYRGDCQVAWRDISDF